MASLDLAGVGLPTTLALRVGGHLGPVYRVDDPVLHRANFMGAHVSRAARIEPIPRIDDADEVAALLKHLPEREARIFRMYHLDGRSYREISQALGVPENSIGPTLSRSREKLRELRVADTA